MKSITLPFRQSKIRKVSRAKIVEIISSLFILLFLYTALSKFMGFAVFKSVLFRSPLIFDKAPIVAWTLPISEIIVCILLFIPRTRRWGLYASLLMMAVFTAYIGYMIYYTPHLPCSCGGVLSQMTWQQHLVFNIGFTLLALAGVLLNRKRSGKQVTEEEPPVMFT